MNMQRTIKVRRANTNKAGIGRHLTLTNVRNETGQMFAFALTDEGEECYIPANIVKAQQMTEADIGAGLTCPVRPNPRANAEANNPPWVAINPVKWDDENPEEIVVEVDTEDADTGVPQAEWDKLVDALTDVTDLTGPARKLTEDMEAMIKAQQRLLTSAILVRDELTKARRKLDELAPEVNE